VSKSDYSFLSAGSGGYCIGLADVTQLQSYRPESEAVEYVSAITSAVSYSCTQSRLMISR
jgi:hypothetical protein